MIKNEKKHHRSRYPRINLAFYDDHLDFCREQALKQHLSITQYVNSLIAREQAQKKQQQQNKG